jgi:uncharacterized membrane protein YcaP (DUF421 family)
METIIRTAVVYLILLVLIRLTGRRTLAQVTAFDFVVLLIIGGSTQRALLGQDYSVINAVLVVVTLLLADVALSLIERDSPLFAKIINGMPMIIVEDGQLLQARLRKARLTESDVLAAARSTRGIERLSDIKFAILEANGNISVIAAAHGAGGSAGAPRPAQ